MGIALTWQSISMGVESKANTEARLVTPLQSPGSGVSGELEQSPPASLKETLIPSSGLKDEGVSFNPPFLFPETLGSSQESLGNSQSLVEAAAARINSQAESYVAGSRHDLPIGPITTIEALAILREAGWPEPWIADILTIAACESSGGKRDADGPLFHPGETGDGGNSLGWLQLWSGWFPAAGEDVERWFDPLVNARVGLYVRQVRNRFGGNGGWSCATNNGIP